MCLIFVGKGHGRKFFNSKISQSTVSPSLYHEYLSFSFAFQVLNDRLSQLKEEAMAKVKELQVKLIEMEYNVRKEVSQEFAEQLTEIEDKHM